MTESPDPTILRVVDANLNRASEALRVIEDYARFIQNAPAPSADLKQCRHDLRAIRDRLGPDRLLAARDVDHDIGRELKTEAERSRADAESVVKAAFGRLREATRSLDEFLKPIDPTLADIVETTRYRAYALESLLLRVEPSRVRFRECGLYVIITAAFCRRPLEATVHAVLAGGARCVQLREKGLSDAELLERARMFRRVTREYDALLCINDRPDIASLVDADILHVGQDDLPLREVRRFVGRRMLVGISTHTVDQVALAIEQQPDYIAVGPMFPTDTKPQDYVAGPEMLAAARSLTALPLVAIGGITSENADAGRAAGADVLCVCTAVIAHEDPTAAVQQFLR